MSKVMLSVKECKERAHKCPTCSVELSKVEAEVLNADGCAFHSVNQPRASIIYTMLQGALDAMIYNAKVKKSKEGIDELDLKTCYQTALCNAGALDYRNIITLEQKFRLLLGVMAIKPIVGEVE